MKIRAFFTFLFVYLQVKPLIWIESVIERHAHSRIEFMVKAKSQFKRRSTANNVEIIIPVPNDADSPKFKTTIGHCKYEPETQSIKWTIKSFPGKFWLFFLGFISNFYFFLDFYLELEFFDKIDD